MSYPHPSLSKVIDDESHYREFDVPLASDGSDFEEIASVEADDIFSDDDSCFSLTSVEIDMRRGWNNRASALGTDETIIIDAENDLNLQTKKMKNYWMTMKKMMQNLRKECQLFTNSYLKTGLYTFHLILKLVVNTVGLSRFRAKSFS